MTNEGTVRVSIIVACRNEMRHIRTLLDSLLAQELSGIPWEAIIADGMSDDGTREILEEYVSRHPQLRCVSNPGRIVSTGLNTAIGAARGEIVIRMDAHSTYAPSYSKSCVETLERTGADNVGGPARTKAVSTLARAVAAAYHSRFSTGGAKFHDESYEGWVDTVPYGCWHKTTLERLGLFDENLVRNQDDELNLRLIRAAGTIWQSPDIMSWYYPRTSVASLFHQYFQYGFWKVAVIRKHRLPGSWRHMVPMSFVLANILLLACMAITKIGGSGPTFVATTAAWLTLITAYLIATLSASLAAAKNRGWATLPYLPVIFAAYHFSYGFGFLAGMGWYFSKPNAVTAYSRASLFTRISR